MNKVAVFGLGRSGMSAIKFLGHLGLQTYVVNMGEVSSWPASEELFKLVPKSQCFSQDDSSASDLLAEMDAVILSPGIAREHSILVKALASGVEVINEIELALRYINIPIIGITGTNGKTTTTTICQEIFKASGVLAFVGGNIGIPFCDYALAHLRDGHKCEVAVLELSSFQLESTPSLKPKKAAILNIYPNHGERYENVRDYARAKVNIANKMDSSDTLFICENEEGLHGLLNHIHCELKVLKAETEQAIRSALSDYSLSEFKLLGVHNLSNLLFAIELTKDMGATKEGIQKTINSFCGVEFRLQYVPTKYQFEAFNDAKSTNWDATLTALNSFLGRKTPLWLIIGGQARGRGDSISPYLSEIREKVTKIIFIGHVGPQLLNEVGDKVDSLYLESLDKVKEYVVSQDFTGDLLFSPAFPSFDQFKDYTHRGRVFNELFGK